MLRQFIPQLTIAAVLLVQSQQSSQPTPNTTIPLTLYDRIAVIERTQAEEWYKALSRADQPDSLALKAALELALGSIPDECTVEQARARLCLLRGN